MNSPPEDIYALNEAAQLGINEENRRFGYDQAKETDRLRAEQKAAKNKTAVSVIPMPAPQTGGRPSPDGGAADGGTGIDR